MGFGIPHKFPTTRREVIKWLSLLRLSNTDNILLLRDKLQGNVARNTWFLPEVSECNVFQKKLGPNLHVSRPRVKMAAACIKDAKNNKGILYFLLS